MDEYVYNGKALEYIVTEAEVFNKYNSIRWWVNGNEVNTKDIEMVIYNDENEEIYAVTVGGYEMTSAYLTWDEAIRIKNEYLKDGYQDVSILNKFKTEKEKTNGIQKLRKTLFNT